MLGFYIIDFFPFLRINPVVLLFASQGAAILWFRTTLIILIRATAVLRILSDLLQDVSRFDATCIWICHMTITDVLTSSYFEEDLIIDKSCDSRCSLNANCFLLNFIWIQMVGFLLIDWCLIGYIQTNNSVVTCRFNKK